MIKNCVFPEPSSTGQSALAILWLSSQNRAEELGRSAVQEFPSVVRSYEFRPEMSGTQFVGWVVLFLPTSEVVSTPDGKKLYRQAVEAQRQKLQPADMLVS